MPITSLFRTILLVGLVASIISSVAGASLTGTLPNILQDYLSQQSQSTDTSDAEAIIMFFLAIPLLILAVVATVGLWKFKRWARIFYFVITIGSIVATPMVGPVVMNSWEAMFAYIGFMLDGVLIAMLFIGPISQEFQKQHVK